MGRLADPFPEGARSQDLRRSTLTSASHKVRQRLLTEYSVDRYPSASVNSLELLAVRSK